jgi:peptide/nickel transport system ATP-binding protein/oligopeptide transport system ATP-binding protein
MTLQPLLSVRDLKKYFPVGGGLLGAGKQWAHAVDGVSFEIRPGEVFSLVGESGCGKSTTGRLILRLIEPTAGEISFMGENLLTVDRQRLKALRREMQIIFQDPYASLNPRMTIGDTVEEPLRVHGIGTRRERKDQVAYLLQKVGLSPDVMSRYPHEFSGGQRQRVGVARAIALRPKLIVADEPVSSLDVSIQAQVINLLEDLQQEFQIAYLFIAHDLNVVRHLSNRVAVMYLGKIVEVADVEDLFRSPLHPYTQALLSSIPVPDPRRKERKAPPLTGDIPNPVDIPRGCRFHTRCPKAIPQCQEAEPELKDWENGHLAACIRVGER